MGKAKPRWMMPQMVQMGKWRGMPTSPQHSQPQFDTPTASNLPRPDPMKMHILDPPRSQSPGPNTTYSLQSSLTGRSLKTTTEIIRLVDARKFKVILKREPYGCGVVAHFSPATGGRQMVEGPQILIRFLH